MVALEKVNNEFGVRLTTSPSQMIWLGWLKQIGTKREDVILEEINELRTSKLMEKWLWLRHFTSFRSMINLIVAA